jgi:poly-gamma-glutamate capsule biosynthesis protein CapA/YwtB (metallophosphatase superfamily)
MSRALLVILSWVLAACTATAAPISLPATSEPTTPDRPIQHPISQPIARPITQPTAEAISKPAARPPVASPNTVDPPAPDPTLSVRLMAVGDLMLGWEVGRKIVKKGPAAPWAGVKQYFDKADLVVANLECVISTRGNPWPSKLIHLRTPLAAADSLVAGGIDVVTVANNHALDFGRDAFGDTLAALDSHHIAHAGGGSDAAAAHAPTIVEKNGVRIAFLGYVLPFSSRTTFNTREWEAGVNRAGLAIGTPDSVSHDVALVRDQVDVVVVMVHGGVEMSGRPSTKQRNFARAAIDGGASLVLGHHPHVLQGYMKRGDTLVTFSLGNFMFARFDGAANDSAILDVTLTQSGVMSLQWIPVLIDRGGIPRPATGADAQRILKRLPAL